MTQGGLGADRKPQSVQIGRVRFRVADDQPTFWDRAGAGRWEPGTLSVLDWLVSADTALLDLGAWVGPVSLYAAALGARVVAVEPDPVAIDQLGRNVAANPELASRIAIVPNAVGPTAGPMRLGARRKMGDSMSSALLATGETAWTVLARVPADLASGLPDAIPLLVKLDIEGGEYELLPELAPLLRARNADLLLSLHPAILRETGEPDPEGRALAALSAFADMTSFAIGPGGAVPAPIERETLRRCDTWLLRVLT